MDITQDLELKINETIQLIYVGRIHPRKTVELIIDSLNILKKQNFDFHFSIVGQTSHDPKYWKKLSKLISKYQLWDNITIHNEIEYRLMPELLQSHDVLLFSTDDRNYPICEGLPNVILEGMANGLAIITTKAGDIPEVVTESNGFLLEPNPEEFADKIKFLIQNKNVLLQMKKENIKTIAQNYSSNKVSALYLKAFEQVIKNKKLK